MLYKVWCEEYGQDVDDARDVKACDPREAAEIWARDADTRSADYTIVGGTPAKVKVKQVSIADMPAAEFIVFGETVAHYSARAVVANAEAEARGEAASHSSALLGGSEPKP